VVDIHSLAGQMMAWSLKTQGFLSSRMRFLVIMVKRRKSVPKQLHKDMSNPSI